VCAAEQRSKRGGSPRAMFEGEYRRQFLPRLNHEPEFCEWPAIASSARNPKGGKPGVAFFCLLFLAKQEK
jgi:hypothetical protein